jgi:hypothetical protein
MGKKERRVVLNENELIKGSQSGGFLNKPTSG